MQETEIEYRDRDIHMVQGDSAGGSLLHCLKLPLERLFANPDDLSCGPLASVANFDRWQNLRRRYWRIVEKEAGLAGNRPDPSQLFIRLRVERERVEAAESIFLWLGTTLAEQLLLASLVAAVRHLQIEPEAIRLLELDSPRPESDRSIGILNCEELRTWCRWRDPAPDELASYEEAWQAVSSPAPDDLIACCEPDSPHPAALKEALSAFMARYPGHKSGLNYWDDVILESCRTHGPSAARIIGHTVAHDRQYADWPGDGYLFCRLQRMGDPALPHPMVELSQVSAPMRKTKAMLTDAGRKVLSGKANFVTLNGVDDQVGGVHLNSKEEHLWVYDGATLVSGQPGG